MYYSACWCTLGNTEACKVCPNNPDRKTNEWITTTDNFDLKKWIDEWNKTYSMPLYPYYDSDKYELVEKKDYRLNQLEKQLEEKKQSSEYYSKVIDKEISYLAELNKEIEQLKSEIDQLEEKKE